MVTISQKITLALLCVSIHLVVFAKKTDHHISFIIPCYNVADKVEKTIASIHAQKIDYPIEIICCDDGSTDNTFMTLLECKRTYGHLKILKHPVNRGAGAAANTCVRASTGDLFYRLDADNILPKERDNLINALVERLDVGDCDAVMVEHMLLFEGDKNIKSIWRYDAPGYMCDLEHCINFSHNPAMSGNYLCKRSVFDRVGGYPEDHGSDTFRFGFKLYATGGKIAILKDTWYWHFYNPEGYWWREQKTGNNDRKAIETIIDYKDLFTRTSQRFLEEAQSGRGSLFLLINNKMLKLKK